jgi:adenosylhomocysteinase
VLAQLERTTSAVYTDRLSVPKGWMVVRHRDAARLTATALTAEQAAYIGVPVDGPYKLDHYRY